MRVTDGGGVVVAAVVVAAVVVAVVVVVATCRNLGGNMIGSINIAGFSGLNALTTL
jgi:hypothetical protein